MSACEEPTQTRKAWMVHAFVVFALLLLAAWIRLLTIESPAPYDETNGDEWSAFARSVTGMAFSACVGGSVACIALAVTSAVRRATRTVERVLWLLVAPAMMVATWMVWWSVALGVGV